MPSLNMSYIDANMLKSKFRGSLMGVLLGDCLGGPFEGDEFKSSAKATAQKYFDLMGLNTDVPYKHFSDEYAMTKAVAKALIEKQPVDYEHVAKTLVEEFTKKSTRGYEAPTVSVYSKLKAAAFKDLFSHALTINVGHGYAGAGGSSRVSPIALFYHRDYTQMAEVTTKVTSLTHADPLGIHGALLQSIAINESLHVPSHEAFPIEQFLDKLITRMGYVEGVETGIGLSDLPYVRQLKNVMHILQEEFENQHSQDKQAVQEIGTSNDAIQAVPMAIFCFLRAHKSIERVQATNSTMAAVQYALGLGGSTDLICSLTGAIAGAYSGDNAYDKNILKHLEYPEQTIQLADELYDAHLKTYGT